MVTKETLVTIQFNLPKDVSEKERINIGQNTKEMLKKMGYEHTPKMRLSVFLDK